MMSDLQRNSYYEPQNGIQLKNQSRFSSSLKDQGSQAKHQGQAFNYVVDESVTIKREQILDSIDCHYEEVNPTPKVLQNMANEVYDLRNSKAAYHRYENYSLETEENNPVMMVHDSSHTIETLKDAPIPF